MFKVQPVKASLFKKNQTIKNDKKSLKNVKNYTYYDEMFLYPIFKDF